MKKVYRSAPGNTVNGCRMCWVDRNGGKKGGSWGSWPVEFEDEGEVIGGSFAAAIKLLPAVRAHGVKNKFEGKFLNELFDQLITC